MALRPRDLALASTAAGVLLLAIGCWALWPPLLIVLGLLLVAFGLLVVKVG